MADRPADSTARAGTAPRVTDAEDPEDHHRTGLPPKAESWRRRSATGAVLTGFAMGLREVFEPERKEPAITMETSGEPPTDLPVEAELEAATTRRSVVRIRPWLLAGRIRDKGGSAVEDPDQPGR